MIIQIEPWIDEEELFQLKRVVDSTFVTESSLTKEFEEKIKDLTSAEYAIAMTNGTVALYSCLKAFGIGPGDEVIVPNLTFIATANSVIMCGATPVFADVDSVSLTISSHTISEVMSDKVKAVIPVHLYGRSADMEDLSKYCIENSLLLIEDAAQGVGVKFKNKHVGTFGDAGFLSFYGNKTITCGEGGVVLTNSREVADKCYALKNHGRLKKGVFIHDTVGFNFCFTEMQAAVGIAQLNKLDRIIRKKSALRREYEQAFSEEENIKLLNLSRDTDHVFWFTSILTPYAEALSEFLGRRKIQTRRFFYPLHLQPCYEKYNIPIRSEFHNSLKLYNEGLSLPSSYNLTKTDHSEVINAIREFMRSK